jgi:hypothetical protein
MTKAGKWKGHCACGAIQYKSKEEPSLSFYCQCRQCQRATGSGHAALFVVSKNSTIVTGAMKFYDQKADSGNIVSRGFYPNCGSPAMNKTTSYPDNLIFSVATLGDPGIFDPTTTTCSEFSQSRDYIDL